MAADTHQQKSQTTAEFWKAYFRKFSRRIADHEPSETSRAPLSADTPASLPGKERRKTARPDGDRRQATR
jgi:hypothetical protein